MLNKQQNRLRKELGPFHVFAIATGTTLSAGFFLLPGLAANYAGPAVPLAYLIAVVPLVPAVFSIIELATAMPRAGGVYYFLDRTLGPMIGTVGGLGTWAALVLKVSFALIGMGAYIKLFFPALNIVPVAVVIALVLGSLSLFGSKKSGKLQVILVSVLLFLLLVFIGDGIPKLNYSHFENFFSSGWSSIFAASGLVYISYVGITKIASLSEEVKNPERNLPLGIFLALGTSVLIYVFGTIIMVGIIPLDIFKGNLTPVAAAGKIMLGEAGIILFSIAALIAFVSVANGGILSASRYPLALSRDHLLPRFFLKMSRWDTPLFATLVTIGSIVMILLLLDPMGIAKLASAFQLMVFAFICLAVIIIRESKIESYDPGYKSPLYPWMQILGMVLPFVLIFEMGIMPLLFSFGLIAVGVTWYWMYARKKVVRTGAIYHLFERMGRLRYDGLDTELRGILKEKGLREADPFDEIVARSLVIDLENREAFEEVVTRSARWFSKLVDKSAEEIEKQFLEGTRMGATPVTHGIALPHIRLKHMQQAEMVIVRGRDGVHIKFNNPLTDFEEDEQDVNAVFFLVSPQEDPTQHLRILAQIAGRVEEDTFVVEWSNAKDEQEIKEALLHEDRLLSISIRKHTPSESLMNHSLKDVRFPEGCLVAILRRQGKTIIPKGNTVIKEGDRLTIIGEPKGMAELKQIYE
jgi:amino acid transporter/mannitol/fructose-specific phosphotransferase system IIA component (Ntr-type)